MNRLFHPYDVVWSGAQHRARVTFDLSSARGSSGLDGCDRYQEDPETEDVDRCEGRNRRAHSGPAPNSPEAWRIAYVLHDPKASTTTAAAHKSNRTSGGVDLSLKPGFREGVLARIVSGTLFTPSAAGRDEQTRDSMLQPHDSSASRHTEAERALQSTASLLAWRWATAEGIAEVRTVNIGQACRLTGRSRRAIYYWIGNGRLPAMTIAGSLRIPVSDLLPFRRRVVDESHTAVTGVRS